MITRRSQDWPVKLANFIQSHLHAPFEWGKNDCCLFACDWIALATGIDPAADLRGKYDSALSAARVLEPLGGVAGVAKARCWDHGFFEGPVMLAQRGDIVLMVTDQGPTLGVCVGSRSAFTGAAGIEMYPTYKCAGSWRIN
jgi:hypothetical protein